MVCPLTLPFLERPLRHCDRNHDSYGHGALPGVLLIAPPTLTVAFAPPFKGSIKASTCAPVAPVAGLSPGIVRMPVVFNVVMRMGSGHAPVMLLPVMVRQPPIAEP